MSRKTLFLLLPLIAGFAAAVTAQTATPVSAAQAFYKFDRTHSQTFGRSAIEARRQWFSPALYRLFQNELRREKEHLKLHPDDKPYFGDGLPFQPIDETCGRSGRGVRKRLDVRPGVVKRSTATVKAVFAFPKPCRDPDTTIYTLELMRSGSGWLIDNVRYEGGRSLVTDLKRKEY